VPASEGTATGEAGRVGMCRRLVELEVEDDCKIGKILDTYCRDTP